MNIPDEYKITTLKHQNTYLVNGELKSWKGDTAEVYSTISSTEDFLISSGDNMLNWIPITLDGVIVIF